jgi:hypothetical protein
MFPLQLFAGSPLDRRSFLVAGTGALGAMAPSVANANASATPRTKIAKSTIMIWLSGGASHIDTWDMKPEAPLEYRGTFQPVATSAADIQLCEHLPHLAQQAHHLALVRSAGQFGRGVNDHHSGYFHFLTGHPTGPVFPNSRTPLPDDWPFVGSVVAAKRPPHPGLPSVLWLPALPEHPRPGTIAAKIGVQHDPVVIQGSHTKPMEFKSPCLTLEGDVTVDRLTDRHSLLKAIDLAEREVAEKARLRNYDELQTKALSLLTSRESKRAFDLTEEPEAIRNRYGNHLNALSMLMARRLVEAGVPFITVNWHDDYEEDKKRGCLGGSWDTHWKNFSCLKDNLLPRFDQPFAALLADLHERGLLEETLVIVTSEMGRTPKLGDPRSGGVGAAEPGRDHWTFCQTVLMAGGGIRGGQVYGSSDKLGGYPADKPVGPEHIIHTIYHAMGIDDLSAVDPQNRPFHLLDEGEPLTALF